MLGFTAAMKPSRARNGTARLTLLGCLVLSALGCRATQQAGVIALSPDAESIPGPMPGFGPFASHTDALLAACPRILSYDNAVVTRPRSSHLRFHRSVPKEYCAWIYSTPQGQYEMSLAAMDPNQRRSRCGLPDKVLDARFPEGQLGYVFAVHNHPLGSELSNDDIGYIVEEASIHGLTVRVGEKEVELGIAAFFSLGEGQNPPECDGFYLYSPRTGLLTKWSRSAQREWSQQPYGRVHLTEKGVPPGFDIKIERVRE